MLNILLYGAKQITFCNIFAAKKHKNMKNETKNLLDSSGKDETGKKYDIFISYRRMGKEDPDHRHSTSLARSVAQAFEKEGFLVFFDCWQGTQICYEALEKSDYYIILITRYSFDEGGDSFKKELQSIKKVIDKTENKKENVFLFNVDHAYKSTKDIQDKLLDFAKVDLRGEGKELLTDSSFSSFINQLINEPEHEGEKRIKKTPRFTYKRYKELYENNKRRKRFFQIVSCILFVALVSLFGINLNQQHIIHQYKNECIVFAGGGTVQQYLNDTFNKIGERIDVKNYQDYPSKYIHLPSKDAWTLLWDDVNEGEEKDRTYCPIVLSTTKIDITEANIEKFKEKRRIVEYNIDSIPLMVQIFDGQNSKAPITLDSLRIMLNDTNNYEIWTTTERSGTYREYKEFLDNGKEFNLDNLVNIQKNGRKNFNPISGKPGDKTKTQLFLANQCYYYTPDKDEGRSDRLVVTDATFPQKTILVPLFVYTVAVKSSGDYFKLLPQADDFFNLIGCDTKKDTITERDSIVVQLDKQKIF